MPAAKGEDAWATYNHNYELPSKVRVCVGTFVHLRWGVPLDEHNTRMWTFTLCKTPRRSWGGSGRTFGITSGESLRR